MARALRIEYEGAVYSCPEKFFPPQDVGASHASPVHRNQNLSGQLYHVTARGSERGKIFFSKRDYLGDVPN